MFYEQDFKHFPYPFKGEQYRYSNNSQPLDKAYSIELSPNYEQEIALKRRLLEQYPERCYQALPHTHAAQWEVVELVIEHLLEQYPDTFSIEKKDRSWTFINNRLKETHTFTFGDNQSLPQEPLDFIGRQVQEDLLLLLQKEDNLYLEAGQLCFPANWSLAFNLGMSFNQIHSPIPGFKEEGLDQRILKFLLGLQPGNPWWRTNWSLMAGNRLDTSLETFAEWGKERKLVTPENAGEMVHLRVEVQKLFRLPRTHALLFTIHTHLLPLHLLVADKERLIQFHSIIQELPDYISSYKGIAAYREALLAYLENQLQKRRE